MSWGFGLSFFIFFFIFLNGEKRPLFSHKIVPEQREGRNQHNF